MTNIKNRMRKVSLKRSGKKPLKFEGVLDFCWWGNGERAAYLDEVEVYRSRTGRWIAHAKDYSIFQGYEDESFLAVSASTPDQLFDALAAAGAKAVLLDAIADHYDLGEHVQ